jgi:hypothetical protein
LHEVSSELANENRLSLSAISAPPVSLKPRWRKSGRGLDRECLPPAAGMLLRAGIKNTTEKEAAARPA